MNSFKPLFVSIVVVIACLGSSFLSDSVRAQDKPVESKKLKVFILAGQSNMEGKGDRESVTLPLGALRVF